MQFDISDRHTRKTEKLAASEAFARIAAALPLKHDVMGVVYCVARFTELPTRRAIVFHLCASLLDERIKNISGQVPPLRALAAGSPPSGPPSH